MKKAEASGSANKNGSSSGAKGRPLLLCIYGTTEELGEKGRGYGSIGE
jgi:uncharacterized protein (DUF2235 family)